MAKANPVVAITGANGFLGTALVEHFMDKGWEVVALVRRPENFRKSVKAVKYDIDKSFDSSILRGVDYLIHAAYVKQDRHHVDALKTNLEAAKTLVVAAQKNKIKKMLFISSMSAHDNAESAYGRGKLAIEKIFVGGKSGVAIRSGLIMGNGGIVKQMVNFMRTKHMVPLIGGGKQPLQVVSIDDLVRAIDILLNSKLYGLYTVATPEVYSYKQFYEAIARHIHTKVLFVPVPLFVLITAVRTIELLPISIPVNKDNVLGLKKLHAVDTSYDLKKIGINLSSLAEALKEIDI